MKRTLCSARGGMTAQTLIILASVGLAGAVQATNYVQRVEQTRKTAIRYLFRLEQASIMGLTSDDDAWLMTLQKAGAPNEFGCLLANGRPCPNGPVNFSLYDANGAIQVNAAPGSGFDLSGNPCAGYVDDPAQTGNDNCPFRVELSWQPFNCAAPCLSVLKAGEAFAGTPSVQINIQFKAHGSRADLFPAGNANFGIAGPIIRSASSSFKKYCEALGGTYDSSTQTCDNTPSLGPTRICPNLNYITGISPSQGVVCQPTRQVSTCASRGPLWVAAGLGPPADWTCVETFTYAWRAGNWGACVSLGTWQVAPWNACTNLSCTTAQQTRTVSCLNGTSGQQTRPVFCERNDGLVVADSFCQKLPKPSSTQSCVASGCTPPAPPTTQSCPLVGKPCVYVISSVGFLPSCLALGTMPPSGAGWQGESCASVGATSNIDWAGSDNWNNSVHTQVPGTGVCPGADCYCTAGSTSVAIRNVYHCQFCPSGNWNTITGIVGGNITAASYGNPYGGEVIGPLTTNINKLQCAP